MHKYQQLIIDRIKNEDIKDWNQIRYDVEAWRPYTQDALYYIDQIEPTGGRAIDIGCAYGTMCAYLASIGWKEVAGIDIELTYSFYLMKKYQIQFQNLDVERDILPYSEGAFDLVVFTEVLEHLGRDPHQAMFKIAWLTSKGGILVLSTPDIESDLWKAGGSYQLEGPIQAHEISQQKRDVRGGLTHHYYVYNKNEVRSIVEMAGFEVETLENRQNHIYCIARRIR